MPAAAQRLPIYADHPFCGPKFLTTPFRNPFLQSHRIHCAQDLPRRGQGWRLPNVPKAQPVSDRLPTLCSHVLSRVASLLAGVLGLQAEDATAGFRSHRRAVLSAIALDAIKSDGYSFLIEMLYRCQRGGWSIGEVPIVFENRQCGDSKISKTEIWKAVGTVLRLSRERFRPPVDVAPPPVTS